MLTFVLANPLRPPAPEVRFSPWRPNLFVLALSSAGVLGLLLGTFLVLFWSRGPLASYEYHLWRWQADTFLSTAFARVGIGPNPDDTAGHAALERYFTLTSQIRTAAAAPDPDLTLLEALENERATYENDVERLLERYISEAVTEAGLQRRLPLFEGIAITWPPVNFELTEPPRLLVRSPRDTIRRSGDTLLKPDLSLRDIEKIEAETTSDRTVSIVISIGGIAAYPAIVRDDRSYDSILETAAHEWVHHYLAFFPLGEQWGKGGDAEALNETTANVAGREIARLVRERHPVDLPQGADGTAPPAPPPTVDFAKVMRELRLEVDSLLEAGKVDEAERRMEETRQYLAENGIFLRKINQAYFAFHGTYADTPASSNPVGPKIEHIWDLTGDVGLFLALMRSVTSSSDLDVIIMQLEAAANPVPGSER